MKNNILQDKRNIHFVGIGGIGMSGIARVMLDMGYKVSGSDLAANDLTKALESIGATIFEGHRPSNILKDTGVLVYSSSVSKENPELAEARKRKIRIVHRAQMLGEIFNSKKGIAVTGTHGKTTTTSLVSIMLEGSGLDPTVIIGGEVDDFKGNAKLGRLAYAVVEADESDSSFLHLKPLYAVITNIEMEHLDHFKDLDHIKKSYRAFIDNAKNGGVVFYNHDDPNCREVLKDYKGPALSFGFFKGADIHPVDIEMDCFNTSFICVYKKRILGKVELSIPGTHNVLNALAAILVGLNIGLKFEQISKAIKSFGGAKRRFELRADVNGVMLIDDYAHHPTEIKAVLDACRNWKNKRLVTIFQPHRYTRTKFLADEFGRCFKGVDKLILTDIYAASEKPIKGVSIKNIYDKAKANGVNDVTIVKKERIADYVKAIKKHGDMIVVLGAGNIKKVCDDICDSMKKERLLSKAIIEELKASIGGKVLTKEYLRSHTSFRIGGPAAIWVEPNDYKDLKAVLGFAKKKKIPLVVIGNGTNILARDEGFKGMVLRLGSPYFKRIFLSGQRFRVGAGYSLAGLVRTACDKGLGGIESLVGIPGTVGGAIYMNAGGYSNPIFKNIGDAVKSLKVMDYSGNIKTLKKEKIAFGYRSSGLRHCIILEASLKLDRADRRDLVASCSRFLKIKLEKQVLDAPSAGCVFKNPENVQFTCGQMIDMLGLKGKRIGGAEISTKHANFIVNKGNSTCQDVLALIGFIRNKVKKNYDIPLELEVKVI